jgi:hypothetical protein
MIIRTRTDLSGMECSAVFSDCERYRYRLDWRWPDLTAMPLVALMLNPSTATHEVLDPTVAGLVKRARAWRFAGVIVINLFAFRATDPDDMLAAADPVGQANDDQIREVLRMEVAERGGVCVAAWGKHGRHRGRDGEVLSIAREEGVALHAFQINGDGSPKHPLYVKHNTRPALWSGR